MRIIVSIAAFLIMLGLAAFGIISAQKVTAASQMTASVSSATAGSQTASTALRRHPVNPINELAQNGAANAPSLAPILSVQPKPAPAASVIPACDKPGGMGLTRIVEIDTTGGPGFGFEHFKQYDFLRDKEVVLTFDDGPWPGNTPAVLKALTDECLKATFFEIGEHATWHPEITKQVIAAGMTVGTHTCRIRIWRATRTPRISSRPKRKSRWATARCTWPPAGESSRRSSVSRPSSIHHSCCRIWPSAISGCSRPTSTSRDFKLHKPEDVIKSVMSQLEKHGKGIILMHDFKRHTAEALPELIRQLKAGGYEIVHMVPKGEATTVPKYDEMLAHEDKLSSNNTRPESSVIRTIGE